MSSRRNVVVFHIIGKESIILASFTIALYDDWGPFFQIRKLAYPVADRWAFDIWRLSFILELWFLHRPHA